MTRIGSRSMPGRYRRDRPLSAGAGLPVHIRLAVDEQWHFGHHRRPRPKGSIVMPPTDPLFAPDYKDEPFWWQATPRPQLPQTELPARADGKRPFTTEHTENTERKEEGMLPVGNGRSASCFQNQPPL